MFCDYFLIFILSLPILGCSVFGFYLLSLKKPFLYNTKDEKIPSVCVALALVTFFAVLNTDNSGLVWIFAFYIVLSLAYMFCAFKKGDIYLLHGVDEKVTRVFLYFLKAHKISYFEKFDIMLTDTCTKITINYSEKQNSCSVLINGESNNMIVKEVLNDVVDFYTKKQSKAYKKTAIFYILIGLIIYGLMLTPSLVIGIYF